MRISNAQPHLDGFLRSIGLLVSGTAGSQIVNVIAMPILSRLYSPDDFGALAVFTGIITTIAVAASFRYDIAVALPESDNDSFALFIVALASALVASVLTLILIYINFDWFVSLINKSSISTAFWIIPLGIFAVAAWSSVQNWNIRSKNFNQIARVRVLQTLAGCGTQMAIGYMFRMTIGLLIGIVISNAFGAFYFTVKLRAKYITLFKALTKAQIFRVAFEYRRFPVYSTWEALANSAAIHLPIILIAKLATTTEAGFLMMAMYAMQAPMSLIGAAIAQVYLSHAPEAHRKGQLSIFTVEVLSSLIKTGVGPILAIGILSPIVFAIVFGPGWERAGWLVTWMTPWFVFQFLASPISMALHVVNRQRSAMFLQILSLLIRVAAVWGTAQVKVLWIGEAYAISGMLVYATYIIVVATAINITTDQIYKLLLLAMQWALPWVIVSLVFLLFLN